MLHMDRVRLLGNLEVWGLWFEICFMEVQVWCLPGSIGLFVHLFAIHPFIYCHRAPSVCAMSVMAALGLQRKKLLRLNLEKRTPRGSPKVTKCREAFIRLHLA